MLTEPAASDPGTHLDCDQMVDLSDGLLDAVTADRAWAHLASCPLCSADFALIAGESELSELGELLPSAPIPPDVMARIEAALHREPPLKVTTVVASSQGSHHRAAAPRRRRFRITLGAVAGAALVVAGGIGVGVALNGRGSSPVADHGAASGGTPSFPNAGGSHAVGRLPNGAMSPQGGVGPDPNPAGALSPHDLSIDQQARGLLQQHVDTPALGGDGPQCTPTGVAIGTKLLASTRTQYEGRAAWLMVYAESGRTTVADVYVVDVNACVPGNPGPFVDHFEIPRP